MKRIAKILAALALIGVVAPAFADDKAPPSEQGKTEKKADADKKPHKKHHEKKGENKADEGTKPAAPAAPKS
jgi:hypothetical protein